MAGIKRDQSIRDDVVTTLTKRLRADLGADDSNEDNTLSERADPVLGHLWRNAADAAYDKL